MSFWVWLLIIYGASVLLAMRRLIVHLAWQPMDESREVADKPDWGYGIYWGLLGALVWPGIFMAWMWSEHTSASRRDHAHKWYESHSPLQGRFEVAAQRLRKHQTRKR